MTEETLKNRLEKIELEISALESDKHDILIKLNEIADVHREFRENFKNWWDKDAKLKKHHRYLIRKESYPLTRAWYEQFIYSFRHRECVITIDMANYFTYFFNHTKYLFICQVNPQNKLSDEEIIYRKKVANELMGKNLGSFKWDW